MNTELIKAQQAVQNARKALRSGDRRTARQWAEQAARLAPQLEDPWLILAAVASPSASMKYIERALQINPDSPRARKGMEWALKRLQNVPAAKETSVKRRPAQRVAGSGVFDRIKQRKALTPILLFALGCIVVLAAAWTASTTPVLASLTNSNGPPTKAVHPQVWARVEISKPSKTAQAAPALAAAESTATPILPTPTLFIPTPTVSQPTAQPTQNKPQPTGTSAMAPPTATTQPEPAEPTLPPTDASTPAGSFTMNILENTPTVPAPTAQAQTQPPAQNPPVGNGVPWIEVNLTEQRVYAWKGDTLMNSFIVSTGTWQHPTVVGTFQIWNKTPIQAMSGPGYYLPNVPWVMYFYKDYGFHGTYWHNNFGTPMSHGCVNLTIPDSQWLYNFASVGTTVKVHY